ncbi:hypothetical protein AURDEDRAFT_147924 [Auricularia subglabra TFB-10046 SS5]|nr:hypothetical protein AURDEDRAFT_147924 [Auricularia subglabra TFB-10046 SS5]
MQHWRRRLEIGSSSAAVAVAPRTRPLPTELWDATLDHIIDAHTLHACTLVCRAWSPRAHHNLLRHIVVAASKRRDRVSMSMNQFNAFFAEDAQARSFVRSLDVGDVSRATDSFLGFIDTLELFYGAKVTALALRYCSGDWISARLLDTCKRAFSNVTSLDLDWSFRTIAQFSQVVYEYKQLRDLTLRCLVPRQLPSGVVPPSFAHPCAVHLESPTTRGVLADWLALDIKRFDEIWVSLEEHSYEILNQIADDHPECLSRVKSLTFNFDSDYPNAHATWRDLAARLRLCTQLEELRFVFVDYPRPPSTLIDEFEILLKFPPSVRRIIVDGEVERCPEWLELGEALMTMFPLLEELPSIMQRAQAVEKDVEPEVFSPVHPELVFDLNDGPPLLRHESAILDFSASVRFPRLPLASLPNPYKWSMT